MNKVHEHLVAVEITTVSLCSIVIFHTKMLHRLMQFRNNIWKNIVVVVGLDQTSDVGGPVCVQQRKHSERAYKTSGAAAQCADKSERDRRSSSAQSWVETESSSFIHLFIHSSHWEAFWSSVLRQHARQYAIAIVWTLNWPGTSDWVTHYFPLRKIQGMNRGSSIIFGNYIVTLRAS